MNRARAAVPAVAVATALILAACSTGTGKSAPPAQARPEFVEKIRLPGGDNGLPTPFISNARGPGTINVSFVFDSLLWKDSTGGVIPWLAKEWTVSPDGLEWRFVLRDGIKWHDGRPLTAEDVKFTYDYMNTGPGQKSVRSIASQIPGAVTTVESPTTVVIKLTKPFSSFAVSVAGRTAIVPKHVWENVADPMKATGPEALIGSGPYTLESYDPASGSYAFVANQSYFLGVPYVRRLEFVPAPNQLLALSQGEIDVASPAGEEGYPPEAVAPYENNPRYGMIIAPGEGNRALHFNLTKGFPYSEKKFRQALAYAIDRRDMVKRVLLGQGSPGSMGGLAPSNPYTASDLPAYELDLAKARALLDEIGMKDVNGDGFRELPDGSSFTAELQMSSGSSAKPGESIKEYLRVVGIRIEIKSLDATAADASSSAGTYELALVTYGGLGGDPDFLRTRLASTVRTPSFNRVQGYVNPTFDDLAAQQLTAVNEAERKAVVQQMQRVVAEDLPLISLFVTNRVQIFDKTVFDAWYFTPGGVFGGYPGLLNKHVFVTGKAAGF